jgi:serine/threonine-protein kinase RsbW
MLAGAKDGRWFAARLHRTAHCMALSPRQKPGSFECHFPARADRVAEVRRTLGLWLRALRVREGDRQDIVLAVSEAVSNAVEHALPGGRATVRVNASIRGDSVIVSIADDGRWRTPRRVTAGGRGIGLMNLLCDRVEIEHGRGTRVKLSKKTSVGVV